MDPYVNVVLGALEIGVMETQQWKYVSQGLWGFSVMMSSFGNGMSAYMVVPNNTDHGSCQEVDW